MVGFRLDRPGEWDPDEEDNERLWSGPWRFDVPTLGLRDVAANAVIAHFGGRQSHNRDLFSATIN